MKDGRAWPLATVLWIIIVTLVVTPAVAIGVALLLGAAGVHSVVIITGGFIAGIVFMVYLMSLGVKRNWPASYAGWVLIAVICIPGVILIRKAFVAVSAPGQDKTALSNARGLAAAADQYYLEYGVTSVETYKLVGATNYLKALNPVAHESYPEIFVKDQTITVSGIAGLRTITYAP